MKYALLPIFFAVLITGCGKKDEGRPEFGGKSAQAFYSGFQTAAVDCDKAKPQIVHHRLNYNGRDYFDYRDGDELDIYLYFVGSKFRMEFSRSHYGYGGRTSIFKSVSTDRESVTGDWFVQGKRMVLISSGDVIADFGDGTPVNEHETLAGKIQSNAQRHVKIDLSEAVGRPVRVIQKVEDDVDASSASLACSGHMADAVNVK